MATNQFPQLTLITSAIAANMESNLVVSRQVRWRPRKNNTTDPLNKWKYVERVGPRYNVRKTTGNVADISAGKQNRVFGAETFELDNSIGLDYDYSDFAHIRDEDRASRDESLRMIGVRAGEDTDAVVLKALVEAGNNWVGTPGNDVNDIGDLLNGFVRLKEEGVPSRDIFAILAYKDYTSLAKYLLETTTANAASQERIITATIGEGFSRLAGINVLFTQQLPVMKTGTRTNGLVNGAAQNVNYKDVVNSTTTNGQFLTQTIAADNFGANGTVKDGEVFTIAGVTAWDNRKGASQGRLQQFRVVGDHTADAGGAIAALRIFPAMVVQNASITGDLGVNNAHATVGAAPADNAAITFNAAADTEFLQRAIVSRQAIRVESADLEDASSGENSRQRMKSIPLSLHGYKFTDGNTRQTTLRFDSIYRPNVEPFGRYHTVRING